MATLFNYFNRWNIEFSFGNFVDPCVSLMHSKSSRQLLGPWICSLWVLCSRLYMSCPSRGTWYCDSEGGQWNLMSDSYLCRCACAHLCVSNFLFWNTLPSVFIFFFNFACHMRFLWVLLSLETVLILPATSVLLASLSDHVVMWTASIFNPQAHIFFFKYPST